MSKQSQANRKTGRDAVWHLRLVIHGRRLLDLYAKFFPKEFAQNGVDLSTGEKTLDTYDRFARLVGERLFPVAWPSENWGIYEDPEYYLNTCFVYAQSIAYYAREADEFTPLEKLIISGTGHVEFEDAPFFTNKNYRFDFDMLRLACGQERGILCDLPLVVEALTGQSGNNWLDIDNELLCQSELPEWSEEIMRYIAEEWTEAKIYFRAVGKMQAWVNKNPESRLKRVEKLLKGAIVPVETARVKVRNAPQPLVEILL